MYYEIYIHCKYHHENAQKIPTLRVTHSINNKATIIYLQNIIVGI